MKSPAVDTNLAHGHQADAVGQDGGTLPRRIGLLLSVWSFGFACVHMAWAAGWRGGLPADSTPISDRPWFLAHDVVAGLLMYGAAGVAVLLALGRGSRFMVRATLVGSLVALGRGVPAVALDLASGEHTAVGLGVDVWFTVAGVLGLVLARQVVVTRRRARHVRRRVDGQVGVG